MRDVHHLLREVHSFLLLPTLHPVHAGDWGLCHEAVLSSAVCELRDDHPNLATSLAAAFPGVRRHDTPWTIALTVPQQTAMETLFSTFPAIQMLISRHIEYVDQDVMLRKCITTMPFPSNNEANTDRLLPTDVISVRLRVSIAHVLRPEHSMGAALVCFSDTANTITTTTSSGESRSLVGHSRAVTCLLDATHDSVLSSSLDGTIRLWCADAPDSRLCLDHGSGVWAVSCHPTRPMQCVASLGSSEVVLWDMEHQARTGTLTSAKCLNEDPLRSCCVLGGSAQLVAACTSSSVSLFDGRLSTNRAEVLRQTWDLRLGRLTCVSARLWVLARGCAVECALSGQNGVPETRLQPNKIVTTKDPDPRGVLLSEDGGTVLWGCKGLEAVVTSPPHTCTPELHHTRTVFDAPNDMWVANVAESNRIFKPLLAPR
eukprot:PhM_4_TR5198/c0_g1_i1/m.46795